MLPVELDLELHRAVQIGNDDLVTHLLDKTGAGVNSLVINQGENILLKISFLRLFLLGHPLKLYCHI